MPQIEGFMLKRRLNQNFTKIKATSMRQRISKTIMRASVSIRETKYVFFNNFL